MSGITLYEKCWNLSALISDTICSNEESHDHDSSEVDGADPILFYSVDVFMQTLLLFFYTGFQFIPFGDHAGKNVFFLRFYFTIVGNEVSSLPSGSIKVWPRWQ